MKEIESWTYEREVSPLERMFLRTPYAVVALVARVRGEVTEEALRAAVVKVQARHPNLRVRVREDEPGRPWFTTEGAGEIPIEVVARETDHDWIEVYHQACRVPFPFEERPAIRFILLRSPDVSELVIFCHHIICDGLSLAYLARDLMHHLGDPEREVELLPDPVVIDGDTLPVEVSINRIARFFINRINKQWTQGAVFFDQQDYEDLNQAYWAANRHEMLTVELTEGETTELVERCRAEGVTVNSALTAAFVGAQSEVMGPRRYRIPIAVAGSLRGRLSRPAGEAMGFYAGAVRPKHKHNPKPGLWENARQLHRRLVPLYTDKKLFGGLAVWCTLEPGIMESLPFKMMGGMVPQSAERHAKLSAFGRRGDVISSMLRREGMDDLAKPMMGTAVTNLTRLDFPRRYGLLELDRLIMNPGGAYPLRLVVLVVGAVTCAGKLSLLLEYDGQSMDAATAARIRDRAMGWLLK